MAGLAQNLSFILLGEDKSASKAMQGVQTNAEKVTGAIGGSFGKLGGIIGGEFGHILNETSDGVERLGAKGITLSKSMMVGGAAATTAGVALMGLGSAQKQASDQLEAAQQSAGDSTEKYAKQVEDAVSTAQNFDHSAIDTKTALAKLVEATGSTKIALANMGVVTNLAAARHISLSDAATMVARILGGSGGKTLSQYGITMGKAVDPTKALAAAHAGVTTSAGVLATAQKRLADLQEIDNGKKSLTVAEHIALKNAQDAVAKASSGLTSAQKKLADTSTTTTTKLQLGKEALDQLAKKLDGQGKASVNNFGSQFDIMRTKVVDWVEEMAGPAGQVLTAIGPLVSIAGVALDLYKTKQVAATVATIDGTAATKAASVATGEEAVAMVGLDAAMDANPIGLVALALGGLAAIIGGGMLLSGMQDNSKATADYTTTLETNSGALGANIRALATKHLADSGALEAAAKLGLASNVVVDATLGDASAKRILTDATNAATAAVKAKVEATGIDRRAQLIAIAQTKDTTDSISLLTDQVGIETDSMDAAKVAADHYKSGLNDLGDTAGITSSQISSLRDQLNSLPSGTGLHVADSGHVTFSDARNRATGRATGGTVHPGELTLVGEKGPEYARLPGGTQVYPNGTSPGGGGGTTQVHVHIQGVYAGDQNTLAKMLVTAITNAARQGVIPKNAFSTALTGH